LKEKAKYIRMVIISSCCMKLMRWKMLIYRGYMPFIMSG